MSEPTQGRGWQRVAGLVLLTALALGARLWVNQERVSAGHGDVADAQALARHLVAGRGFVLDHVGQHLVRAESWPAPACSWWMPGPALIAAAGLFVAGDDDFVHARVAASVVSALLVLVCWLLAWELSGRRAVAWSAALLAVGWPAFLGQACLPLSQGPTALCGGLACWLLLVARRRRAALVWFGVVVALGSLCRGDALLWWPTAALTLAWRARRGQRAAAGVRSWPSLAAGLVAFALVCAPWWARNLEVFGRPLSPAQTSLLAARGPVDVLTSRPEQLTVARALEHGAGPALALRGEALARAVSDAARAGWRSLPERPEGWLAADGLAGLALLLTALALLGLPAWFAGGAGPLLVHGALLMLFYGVLFPAVALESFPVGWCALLPATVVAAALGIDALARRMWPRARWLSPALATALALGCVVTARPVQAAVGRGVETMLADHRAFGAWWRAAGRPPWVVYCMQPWEFTLESGVPSVQVPMDGPGEVVAVARRLGLTHLVHLPAWGPLERLRPALASLRDAGRLVPVPGGGPFEIYELRLRR